MTQKTKYIPAHPDNAEEWLQINKDIWPKGEIMISPEIIAQMMTEFANEWLEKQSGYTGLDSSLRKTWENESESDSDFDGC